MTSHLDPKAPATFFSLARNRSLFLDTFAPIRKGYMDDIEGLTCIAIDQQDEDIALLFDNGTMAWMFHHPDWDEVVKIDTIIGNLDLIRGVPLEKVDFRFRAGVSRDGTRGTWSFFTLCCARGSVSVRWWGPARGGKRSTRPEMRILIPDPPLGGHDRMALMKATQRASHAQRDVT